MNIDLGFDLPKQLSSIIKVIGVGGGGGNAVNYMFNQGIVGVDFIVCNTDNQALEMSPVTNKIQIGRSGLGAGANPEIAREAALEKAEEIINSIVPNTRMLFIIAGMGGGTGTGAAPVIADLARQHNILTVGIVTIPYEFEGRKRQQLAAMGINELRKHVDSLIIVDNNKLRFLYGDMGYSQVLSCADQVMSTAAKRIAEIVTIHGYINLDFEDVRSVLKDSKTAIMGYGEASGDNRAERVIREAIKSPLLNDSEIKGAKKILLVLRSGTKELTHDEIEEICSFVYDEAGHQVDLFMGYSCDVSLGESVSVSIIATGIQANDLPENVFDLEGNAVTGNKDNNNENNGGGYGGGYSFNDNTYTSEAKEEVVQKHHLFGNPVVETREVAVGVVHEYVPSIKKEARVDSTEMINKDLVGNIDVKRNDTLNGLRNLSQLTQEETEKMLNEPAYLRKNLVLEEVQPSSEILDGVALDKNNNLVTGGNRFLNPMVD